MALDTLEGGAAAFLALMEGIFDARDRHHEDWPDDDFADDPTDYVEVVDLVHASIEASFVRASKQHREGYLRALADLLSRQDGELDGWDPLEATGRSFDAARVARLACQPGDAS